MSVVSSSWIEGLGDDWHFRLHIPVFAPFADRAPAADFQLDFFNASVHDYVEYRELMPELSSFTVCMWLRLGDDYAPTAASLFSYAVGNQTRALMALLIADNTVLLTVNNASWMWVSISSMRNVSCWLFTLKWFQKTFLSVCGSVSQCKSEAITICCHINSMLNVSCWLFTLKWFQKPFLSICRSVSVQKRSNHYMLLLLVYRLCVTCRVGCWLWNGFRRLFFLFVEAYQCKSEAITICWYYYSSISSNGFGKLLFLFVEAYHLISPAWTGIICAGHGTMTLASTKCTVIARR